MNSDGDARSPRPVNAPPAHRNAAAAAWSAVSATVDEPSGGRLYSQPAALTSAAGTAAAGTAARVYSDGDARSPRPVNAPPADRNAGAGAAALSQAGDVPQGFRRSRERPALPDGGAAPGPQSVGGSAAHAGAADQCHRSRDPIGAARPLDCSALYERIRLVQAIRAVAKAPGIFPWDTAAPGWRPAVAARASGLAHRRHQSGHELHDRGVAAVAARHSRCHAMRRATEVAGAAADRQARPLGHCSGTGQLHRHRPGRGVHERNQAVRARAAHWPAVPALRRAAEVEGCNGPRLLPGGGPARSRFPNSRPERRRKSRRARPSRLDPPRPALRTGPPPEVARSRRTGRQSSRPARECCR